MNNQDLKTIFGIQEVLKEVGYIDISRLSREILEFSQEADIPLSYIIDRLKKDEPWEYICGKTEFCGNVFKVKPGVLIPRIETEGLVEIGIKEIEKFPPSSVIDVGTGSGAVILSLAKYFKDTDIEFIGSDISKEALSVAEENRKSLDVQNCTFVLSDVLDDIHPKGNYMLTSNPPYITTREYLNLEPSVKEYEPRIAMDGGEDGQSFFKKIFGQIKERKEKPSLAVLECHTPEVFNTQKILEEYLPYSKVEIKTDCFGEKRFLKISF